MRMYHDKRWKPEELLVDLSENHFVEGPAVIFFLDGPDHLVKRFENWHSFDLSRNDQWHRSTLAGELNRLADHVANEVGPGKAERWQRARDIRVVANAIQNNSALGGSVGGLRWRLEIDKPETDEAA
jgi:hypothetical protein